MKFISQMFIKTGIAIAYFTPTYPVPRHILLYIGGIATPILKSSIKARLPQEIYVASVNNIRSYVNII